MTYEEMTRNGVEGNVEAKLAKDKIEHPSDVIGAFGPLQRSIFLYLCLIYIVAPLNNNHIVFTAPNTDFYCVDVDPVSGLRVNLTNACNIGNTTDAPPCKVFEHDRSFHKRTLVNQFDLVCDRAWYASLSQTFHQLGYAVSGILLGYISDKHGRFYCAKISIGLEILSGFGQAFSPNIYWYFLTRFCIGVAAYGRFLNGYVLIAEWVGPKIRGKMSAVYDLGWCAGKLLLPFLYYFIPDYYYVQLGVSTTEIFLFIGYIFVIKESPRWQLTHGKFDKAGKTLRAAALQAGVHTEVQIDERIKKLREFTIKEQDQLKQQKLDKPSMLDIWKDPKLLRISLILYYSWFSMSLVGGGLYHNIGNIGGSLHLNVIFYAFSNIGSNACLYYLIRKTDRRKLVQGACAVEVATILGLLACSFHDSMIPVRILFYNLQAVVAWLAYGTIYVFTTEFFPTQMRQTSIGVCSIFSRMGSTIAPFIKELTIATHLSVPFILFAFLSITNVITWQWLPNTTDIELPDSILQSKKVEEEEAARSRRTSRTASFNPGEATELKLR